MIPSGAPAGANQPPELPFYPPPPNDRDHDMALDADDRCPDQAGAASLDAARNGCPGELRLEAGMLVLAHPIAFLPGTNQLAPSSLPTLQAIADMLQAQPLIQEITVESFVDAQTPNASQATNDRVSTVLGWLVDHAHIDGNRLHGLGWGSTRPLAPDTTPENRARNQRMEFRVVRPTLLPREARIIRIATPPGVNVGAQQGP